MDLNSIKNIKMLLEKYQTKPSKGMGQNFLVHRGTLEKIIETAKLTPNDTVLEIGPGIGVLTQELARNTGKVIAIEKDRTMIQILKETLKDYKNIEVIQGDALTHNYPLQTTHYKLVANLPYYLTSPLIRQFLEAKNPPVEIILMLQKEVAQRICARPPNMSILAVSVQFYAKAEIISYVGKEKFWPSPKVDSAIIKITPSKDKLPVPSKLFFKVVKAGFSHPRKQLASNLSKTLKKDRKEVDFWLLKNGINPLQRAETLTVHDWIRLVSSL